MSFDDLTELIEPLVLPIRGKKYTIPPVSFEDGIMLRSILDGNPDPNLSDDKVRTALLGDAEAELRADLVPDEWIGRVMLTALADWRGGRLSAEIMWKTGGDPKALEALTKQATNRATRRKAPKSSTSTAAAKKTP